MQFFRLVGFLVCNDEANGGQFLAFKLKMTYTSSVQILKDVLIKNND